MVQGAALFDGPHWWHGDPGFWGKVPRGSVMVVSSPPWLLRAQCLRHAWSCMSWGGGEVRGRWGDTPESPVSTSWGLPAGLGGRRRVGEWRAALGRGSWQGFGWRGRAWQGRQHPLPSTALAGGCQDPPGMWLHQEHLWAPSLVSPAPLQLEGAESQAAMG